jgi:predicted ferric reductase
MVAGIMISSRSLPPGAARADAFEAHGFLSLLVLCFSSVHGLALLLDTYIGFTPAQIAIPFTSTYRPLAVGLGIIGLYLLGLIYVSFWLKRFIGYRGWRMLHFGSFAAFVLAAAHGILSGTDSPTVWMALIYSASLIGVIGMLAWKVARARSPKANTAPARLLATAR